MFIEIRALGFELTDAIRMHVESRLEAALGPFAQRLLTVTARLQDINANHGGIDKRCSVVARMRRRGVVVIETVHEDLYSAVDAAATNIRRAVRRRLTRHVSRERKDPQRPGAMAVL